MFGLRRLFGKSKHKIESTRIKPQAIPADNHVIPISVKNEYDAIPFHLYHPTPYHAITILHHRKRVHEWLVAGWYIDTYREGEKVRGLIYKQVITGQDKDLVINELKKLDKEATVKFSLEDDANLSH
jgi:hypothetical protein